MYFYPRSPCGERLNSGEMIPKSQAFLSTLSLRRATLLQLHFILEVKISIHALLAESDGIFASILGLQQMNFYPRSPCGERQVVFRRCSIAFIFLSTLSLRRATQLQQHTTHRGSISIHALLAESDQHTRRLLQPRRNFYPRSPCGERLTSASYDILFCIFLSTLSLRRATSCPV